MAALERVDVAYTLVTDPAGERVLLVKDRHTKQWLLPGVHSASRLSESMLSGVLPGSGGRSWSGLDAMKSGSCPELHSGEAISPRLRLEPVLG
jgi:hypothetical protein